MKAAIYARVSTRDKQNPETQLKPEREYCERQGWEFVEIVDRMSGRRVDRPGYQELLALVRQRQVDVVVVWTLSRLGRSALEVLHFVEEELKPRSIDLVILKHGIDTHTPLGRFFFTVTAAFDELFLDLNRENILAGLDRARAEGKKIGRPRVGANKRFAILLPKLQSKEMSLAEGAQELGMSIRTLGRRLEASTE